MTNDELVIQAKLFSERIALLLIKRKPLRIDSVQDQGSFFSNAFLPYNRCPAFTPQAM